MYSYNTVCSPNLNDLSAFKVVFNRKARMYIDLETDPNIKVTSTYKEYYELFNKRLH